MKLLLIGLLTSGSLFAHARCTYVRTNLGAPDKGDKIVRDVMKKKGYLKVYSKDDAAFEISFDTNWYSEMATQEGAYSNALVILKSTHDNKIIFKESANGRYGVLGTGIARDSVTWSLLKRLMKEVPDCK